jgi:hypothetical protein
LLSSNASVSPMVYLDVYSITPQRKLILLVVWYLKASFHRPYQVKSSWKLFLSQILFFSVFLCNVDTENARIGRRNVIQLFQHYVFTALHKKSLEVYIYFHFTVIRMHVNFITLIHRVKGRKPGLWNFLWFLWYYVHNYGYDLMFWIEIMNKWEHVKYIPSSVSTKKSKMRPTLIFTEHIQFKM